MNKIAPSNTCTCPLRIKAKATRSPKYRRDGTAYGVYLGDKLLESYGNIACARRMVALNAWA